jgi:hypothetical protein
MEDLHKPRGDGLLINMKGRLHENQVRGLESLYVENKKLIFYPCGRKFGKSELAGYVLWRHALLNPHSLCYYIAPENTQGRKIMWDGQRFQRFMGEDTKKYIDRISNLEMKVKLKNGSIIQIFGSENYAAANGLTPSIAVYDEFKVFHPRFHTEFDPNRAAKAAPLVIIGTMPTPGDKNIDEYNDLLHYAQENPKTCAVHVFTTWDNPINHLPDRKLAIETQIEILRARGEEDVVQREYYSKIIPGGSRAIFPMLSKERHVHPHDDCFQEIKNDISKMEWFCVTDPGTTTCFAALIGCVNPYSRKIYILDELYEKDQKMTSTRMIYPRLEALMKKYNPLASIHDDWIKVYDEAAAWFSSEAMQQYGVYFIPTEKHVNKKEAGLSLIKDVLVHDLVSISDNCTHLYDEMIKYAKDQKGNIPNRNDHLIDCFRYLLGASNYNMIEALEHVHKPHPEFFMRKGQEWRWRAQLEEKQEDWTDDWGFD